MQPNKLWWQTGVVYQIYPRSFYDSTGNGVGDLRGVILKLDYLSAILGVDAIWLSPFYPSPMKDFGYDVANYMDVDPLFGSLEDFDHLLEQAHQRNLKVIIDLVPNHTSDQHEWFIESRSTRNNPKRDWYVWRDAHSGSGLPNNWLSVFGGSAWEWDANTGQYYLHSFLKEQPDLNWRNPQVQQAMFAVVEFWLQRGVDGFRVDVAHFLMKDPDLRDNPPNLKGTIVDHRSRGDYDSQIHLYDKGHPDIHQVYRDFRCLLDSYSSIQPRLAIGEIHLFDWHEWARYYGANLDELHMPFNFGLLKTPWQAKAIGDFIETIEKTLPPGAWPNYVLGNHDESRLASRIGVDNLKLAAMLLLTLRGTPTMYYGDEIGMTDGAIPDCKQQDPWGKNVPGLGRDPCRTPMQWNSATHAGFSAKDTKQLWLPIASNYRTNNVSVQENDPHSLLNLYRQLLKIRREYPALQIGTICIIPSSNADCLVYLREHMGDKFIVMLNFSAQEIEINLPGYGETELVISTINQPVYSHGDILYTLNPYEGRIYRINTSKEDQISL